MEYSEYYLTSQKHIRYPFLNLSTFVRIQRIKITNAEGRAIDNMNRFVISISIILNRLKSYLEEYKNDSWVNVPVDKLFLDTQVYFLFIIQYLEDLSMIIRFSIPKSRSEQLSPKFKDLNTRLLATLDKENPFVKYLENELEHLLEIKDIRDDICHSTSFGRSRRATFPNPVEVLASGGGKAGFASQKDLKTYIGITLERILAYANVAAAFINGNLAREHNGSWVLDSPASIVRNGVIDFAAPSKDPIFEPGTVVMTLSEESYDSLSYFIDALRVT